MDFISLYTLLLLNSFIQTSEGASLSSSSTSSILTVSPNRSQFFHHEPISFYCETPEGDSTGWTVMRNAKGKNGQCGDWGKANESFCKLSGAYKSDIGEYWCETKQRQISNKVNFTVTEGAVILDSPVLPVMEGSEVTLRCWDKHQKQPKPSSNLPADFYKDGSLISNTSTENMTIHNVNKSDAGFYKCKISDRGESPESWMDVRENELCAIPPGDQSGHSTSDPSLHLHILIGTAVSFLFLLVLASVLCYRKHKVSGATDDPAPQGVIYAEVTKKKRERPSPGADSAHMIQTVAGGVVTGPRADTVYCLAGQFSGPHTDPVYSLAGC